MSIVWKTGNKKNSAKSRCKNFSAEEYLLLLSLWLCQHTVVFLVTLLRGLSGKVATIVPFPSRLWPWQSFHHNTFRQLWYLSGCIQICVGLFRAPSSETMHIVMQNGTNELSARLSSCAITLPFRREWPFRNANFFQLVRIPIGIKGNWIALFASVKCAA